MRYREGPATASPDLPVVREWVERNPDTDARLTETVEHGGDRVVLIISIPVHEEMLRAQREIPPLVQFPELLRFRRWQPTEQEAVARSPSPDYRLPDAASPTWVTVEKPRADLP
ncbi:hypothetical protein EV645_5345 [Kribbella rubisoli]|uniref:Uncharacterized protein n=1 Tax=Kribbella rubisoli TaxID=3075929 RepID=A0A4Q7WPB8_9ACTN|nr:hypothetical protein [Kribbella rubisoli]RZU12084.1 hypothetical protein EV645_5345 [Kribbella rubisoli]